MAYGIGLVLCFQVILIVANAKKLSDIDTSSSESLGDDDSALTDSEEYSKVNKEYQKYLGEMEVKYYKDLFNKAQSKEEKDEVAFYENILKNVKKLNRPDYKRTNRQGGKVVNQDKQECPEVPTINKEEHYFDQLIMKQQELNRQMMAKYYKELFEAKNHNRSKVVTFDKDLLKQIDEINLKMLTGNGKYRPSHHKSIKRQAKVVWHDDEDDPAVTIPPGCPGSKGSEEEKEFDKKIKYYEQLIRKRQELHNLMMTKYYEDIKEAENPKNVKYDQALLDQIEEINKEIIMEHYQIHDGPTTESSYQTYLQDLAKQKEKPIEQQSLEESEEQPEDQDMAATVHEPGSKTLPEEEEGDIPILVEDGVDVPEPEKPQAQKPKEQPRDKERFHDDVEAGDEDDGKENTRGGIGALTNFGYGGLLYGGKPPLRVQSPHNRPPHKKLVARIDVLNSELMSKYHKDAFDSEKANLDEEVLKQIKDKNRQLVSRYNNNLTKSVKRDITRNMEKHQDKHLNRALLRKLSSRNLMWWVLVTSLLTASSEGRYENVNVRQDWWQYAVIYQIYTRSFFDTNSDGVGDINGIAARLDYLKDIGVEAIRLSPIFKSPMYDFGYDTSDYYNIHPEYGTIEDFERLLKKASDNNIKVILDIQLNHSSNESDWFIKSMNRDEYYSDWYVWEDGHLDPAGVRQPPNNWISVFKKSAWTYSATRDQFYLHQFSRTQPDLNYRNPVVVDEIKNILKFWLEKGVAGFMLISINHLFEVDKDLYGGRYPSEPPTGKPSVGPNEYGFLDHIYTKDQDETYELVSQLRDVVDAITLRNNMTRVLLTEASHTGIKNAVRYYGHGHQNGAHIPINTILMDELDKNSDARDFKYAIDKWITYKPLRSAANWVIGNHDRSRLASRFRSELVDAFNMLVLLLPGIGFTYMGEEIGMINGYVPWTDTRDPLACNTDDPVNFVDVTRDPARTPFQWNSGKNAGFSTADNTWLPVADGFEQQNVGSERSAVRSHYHVYKALTALRARPAFRLGRFESLALNNDVFAFKRWFNDDSYVVVINVGRTYRVVNLTAFDLVFGMLEVEASSVLSSRSYSDNVQANYLDLAADEALVLRMQV